MSYKVKIDIFEGPFDLLVYLIESAEMNIYDIQVSEITGQYLSYIDNMQKMDLAVGGDFMVLAAALIELKSKMLLPRFKQDGTVSEEDPRNELVKKLLEYKRFKTVAAWLEECEEQSAYIIEKPKEDLTKYTGEADIYLKMELDEFVKAFKQFLNKQQRIEDVKKRYERVEKERESMESRMGLIKNSFAAHKTDRLGFWQLLNSKSDKYEIVLTFASILEMAKARDLDVSQDHNFGEIIVKLLDEEEENHVQQ